MINEAIEEMLLCHESTMMIDASKVATVREENTLLHAMMLLTTVRYAAVPVLNRDQKLVGMVTMPGIISGVMDQVEYNWDLLNTKRVAEVMETDVAVMNVKGDLEDVLHLLVDHNFVCVVDDNQIFKGIITRKEMFKRINFVAHEIDRYFDLKSKDEMVFRNYCAQHRRS